MKKFFTRLSFIFFWVILFFAILYLPNLDILPYEKKSINVFAWGDVLDPTILAKFEQDTGIKLNLSYYSSNEELEVKMRATGGDGYDLVMPSDYSVSLLIKEGLLKPLDHSKLNFWHDLNPALLNHAYDPNNRYSIPFEWEIYGLGVNREYFSEDNFPKSWKAIYDKDVIDYKIAITNDPIEAVLFAALYLYGKTDQLSENEFQGIRKLLLEQRNWVEAYSDFRGDYFIATNNCPIALSISALIKRLRLLFPNIEFVIPQEGSFITIESFCISTKSTKEEYIYQLLNYLYTKESVIAHHNNLWLLPATLSSIDELDLEDYEKVLLKLTREDFNQFHFFKNVFPQQKVRDLWVEVKSF